MLAVVKGIKSRDHLEAMLAMQMGRHSYDDHDVYEAARQRRKRFTPLPRCARSRSPYSLGQYYCLEVARD